MKIYIAIPYSKINKELSFKTANKISAHQMNQGCIVFSPISMSHPIAIDHDLPGDWDFWGKFDAEFIDWCDELLIVGIDGWRESTGVQAEIKLAIKYKKKVKIIDPDTLEIKPVLIKTPNKQKENN